MEKQKTNRREWVKSVLIVFLAIMLVLTFFSNTIMNRSLPEVATQAVTSGSINAKIRGSGSIAANETYDVTLSQTRKVRSVLVKVGDEVRVGDTLLTLEAMDSDELKQAQDTLADMELSYQKSLIEASNGSSTENYQIKKLQEKYNEALTTYQLYSNDDPDQLLIQLEKAEMEKDRLTQEQTAMNSDLDAAKNNQDYLDAKAAETSYQKDYETAKADYETYQEKQEKNQQLEAEIARQEAQLGVSDYSDYDTFKAIMTATSSDADTCANNLNFFLNRLPDKDVPAGTDKTAYALRLQGAYLRVNPIVELRAQLPSDADQYTLNQNLILTKNTMEQAYSDWNRASRTVATYETMIEGIQSNLDELTRQINDQSAIVANLSKASTAAESLKAAKQALEDALFDANLGDSGSLDLQHSRDAIEAQKKLVETLTADADGQEIKSTVAGVVSAINTSAGNTLGAETAAMSITIADRGYTLQISVTKEQARQVKIGDTADVTNYWSGDITATLENILNDPKNPQTNQILLFRLSGDGVEAGTNLTLSIGQRSANYDALIPNSAVRSDANGSFVLVVQSKASPLGNRYVATRADVQVLASDDTTSAVSGVVNGDFVITTSTTPIEAGDQVRLVDNG